MKFLVIAAIRFYQKVISPFKGNSCRFYPSCSQYALEAVQKYGIIKGLVKASRRILRCHPFNPGGHDPVK